MGTGNAIQRCLHFLVTLCRRELKGERDLGLVTNLKWIKFPLLYFQGKNKTKMKVVVAGNMSIDMPMTRFQKKKKTETI